MSQHYSDPTRESDPHALPDVEVFQTDYAVCPSCDAILVDVDGAGNAPCFDCDRDVRALDTGWFYWYCFPGCLPADADPCGPYDTEAAAVAAMREESDNG